MLDFRFCYTDICIMIVIFYAKQYPSLWFNASTTSRMEAIYRLSCLSSRGVRLPSIKAATYS